MRHHILLVRGHKLARFYGFRRFVSRVLHKPFTTLVETLVQATSNRLRAIALKTNPEPKSRVLTKKGIMSRKLQSIFQAYFISHSFRFYAEMLFIRAKLQMYRCLQIRAVKWLLKSIRKNPGLYLCAISYTAYFGYFR